MATKNTGIFGEKIAEKYLKQKGFEILDRNYYFRIPGNPQKGEIDIIARKSDKIIFIEVKTSVQKSGESFSAFLPEDRVNFSKQKKLIKTAESWLLKKKISLESKWQIDVLAIMIDFDNKKAKVRHLENAVF